MKVVLASGNAGKLRELTALLAPVGLELIAQTELHLEPADENACTFVENALIKARHASRAAHLPAIADDSGLAVDALGGAPGVRSARYAGEGATDQENNDKLLNALSRVTETSAHYDCVMVYLSHPEDPAPIIASGRWHGRIISSPRGSNGFGYDPYFLVPELDRTAAELDPGLKNRISHRGQAVAELLRRLGDR
ncbi:MAG: RdgB/HAM1 family non-canonical purine NTP pyrophosphatase [Pseudomonadales bacterium]|jgi:XTP/dITP diphosphohydrolase